MSTPRYAVVVPTIGRPSLAALLDRLAEADGPAPELLVVVDDRSGPVTHPVVDVRKLPAGLAETVVVARSGGRGPAAARNHGAMLVPPDVEWLAFLDDDVLPHRDWPAALVRDLAAIADDRVLAGTQGRLTVPLPSHRAPSDRERGTAGLATAWWITADMAYRRDVFVGLGGFDEGFPRAFREDSDLALRVQDSGHRLVLGDRCTVHPVRPCPWWVSVAQQRGNADDVRMLRRHGRRWRDRARDHHTRTAGHLAVTAAGSTALVAAATGRRRLAAVAGLATAVGVGRFAVARVRGGPGGSAEIAAMVATSTVIPPLAVAWTVAGWWRPVALRPATPPPGVDAVLFDRDGTLVEDVPFNGDPNAVVALPGAVDAVRAAREAGLATGVVTNQSGVGRDLLTSAQVEAVNHRIEEIFGGFDVWRVCPHAPAAGCACRKPAPGGVLAAGARLGIAPARVALVGDIGADVEAAVAAGARPVLVPTAATRTEELAAAPLVCARLGTAVRVLAGAPR